MKFQKIGSDMGVRKEDGYLVIVQKAAFGDQKSSIVVDDSQIDELINVLRLMQHQTV
jgi:hypothetical protein